MEKYEKEFEEQELYVGIDTHKTTYHITGMLSDGTVIFNKGIESDMVGLVKYLKRLRMKKIIAVYEAGYFGYELHDYLIGNGIECIVTPPSLIPVEYGNRVKTDRRDSYKLASYLSKGLLKQVYVLTPEERGHRQVVRTRRQLMVDRNRKQNQIKSFLTQHGIPMSISRTCWTKKFMEFLSQINFRDKWLKSSFDQLISAYEFINKQVEEQTNLLKKLAKEEKYKERVAILLQIPGIGIISAMELLLELQEMERFRTGDRLAAYVGLTPSQYSSGEHTRMGHITRSGKPHLRCVLVEASWTFINKDKTAQEIFNRIRARAGTKRAIVAIARRLLLTIRSVIINERLFNCAA